MSNTIKTFIPFVVLGLMMTSGFSLAQTDASREINLDEQVQAVDLEVTEPVLLPDSPFYFLKDLTRNIRSFITFNDVKKVELKLKFANEKIIEAKALAEKNKDSETIKKSIDRYEEELDEIKIAADKIKEKAKDNPKLSSFLDKYTHQQLLHQRILEKLETQVATDTMARIKEARERHLQRFGEVMTDLEDREEKIQERLEKNLEDIKGSEFKQFKNLEILKRLEEKIPERAKEAIQRAQENSLKRLHGSIESMSPEDQDRFKDYINKISGDRETHIEILEDLKQATSQLSSGKMMHVKDLIIDVEEEIVEQIEVPIGRRDCFAMQKQMANTCVGRIIVEKNTKGCPELRCIQIGEETELITCCIGETSSQDIPCSTTTKAKCVAGGGKIVIPTETPCLGCEPKPAPDSDGETRKDHYACITSWNPVCGNDGKTYSNSCFAKSAGIEIMRDGVCRTEKPEL